MQCSKNTQKIPVSLEEMHGRLFDFVDQVLGTNIRCDNAEVQGHKECNC